MIPVSSKNVQPLNWQASLQSCQQSVEMLTALLKLSPTQAAELTTLSRHFPFKIPTAYLEEIRQLDDPMPVLKQYLPDFQEYMTQPARYTADPVEEKAVNQLPGMLHKYPNRVLLTLAQQCAVHCRYCFRRHFAYQDNNPGKAGWEAVYQHISQEKDLNEVILSGGDPLSLPDKYLAWHLNNIEEIGHIEIIRFHSRLPVVIPERITNALLQTLSKSTKKYVFVFHINHADEMTANFRQYCKQLQQAGLTLLNQAVLLQGINDTLPALSNLSYKLFDYGILPYYLHQLDPVLGAAHFQVSDGHAKKLSEQMRDSLPGYLVPKLVYEQPGAQAKMPL